MSIEMRAPSFPSKKVGGITHSCVPRRDSGLLISTGQFCEVEELS